MSFPSYIAATLSGASLRQLQYWRESELLVPEFGKASGRLAYSFPDVLALRTFVYLRERTSLQAIRKAVGNLREFGNLEHLASYKLWSDEGRIVPIAESGPVIDLT